MLRENKDLLWNLEYPLNILAGNWDRNTALAKAGESKIRQSLAHFAIAMKSLYVDGDRDQARAHFQECVDLQFVNIDYYFWARAYLSHLEDENWPHWLNRAP